MHHLYQNGTSQLINGSLTSAPRDDFEVRLSALTAELVLVRQLTERGGFNKVVGDFKSLTDFTFGVQVNLPSDAPKFEHFIDLEILLAGIRQTRVSSEEVLNKEVHAERVKRLVDQYVLVT